MRASTTPSLPPVIPAPRPRPALADYAADRSAREAAARNPQLHRALDPWEKLPPVLTAYPDKPRTAKPPYYQPPLSTLGYSPFYTARLGAAWTRFWPPPNRPTLAELLVHPVPPAPVEAGLSLPIHGPVRRVIGWLHTLYLAAGLNPQPNLTRISYSEYNKIWYYLLHLAVSARQLSYAEDGDPVTYLTCRPNTAPMTPGLNHDHRVTTRWQLTYTPNPLIDPKFLKLTTIQRGKQSDSVAFRHFNPDGSIVPADDKV